MKENPIVFTSRDETLRVKPSAIVYFEADGNYAHITTVNCMRASVCMNLDGVERHIAAYFPEESAKFTRVGKQLVVNNDYVLQVSVLKQKLVLSDGKTFSFTLDASKEALRKLQKTIVIDNGLKKDDEE